MIKAINKTFSILNKKEKRQLYILTITKFFSGLMDMVGIASILPFLAFISNENLFGQNKVILKIKSYFNFQDSEMTIFLAAVSLSLLLLNYLFKIFDAWYNSYVNHNIFVSLSTKLFNYYMSRPYSFHLMNSTNELLEKIMVKVNFIVIGFIQPIFQIFGRVCTTFFITLILFKLNAQILFTLCGSVFFIYFVIFKLLQKKMTTYGDYQSRSSQMLYRITDEAFKAIKAIKINHNEKFYAEKFNRTTQTLANNAIKVQFFLFSPKLFLEIIIFVLGYVLIIYLLIVQSNSFTSIILTLGIFALSFQRLLPSVQGIFSDLSNIKYHKASIDKIYDEVKSAAKYKSDDSKTSKKSLLTLNRKIHLDDVKFKYLNSKKTVLDLDELSIEANNFVGVTGKSGSGKSTLIDLITGLLDPSEGKVFVDEKLLNHKLKNSWQSNIAYVPQQSFIADATIIENIAFSINENEINIEKVKNSAKIANLDVFIENELQNKYETIIGENGIRLSGGQRQRLSIARALYTNLDLLILDEATSSLDSVAERKILESILNSKIKKTIIMVTHRISTLKNCDKIIFLDKGKVVDSGSYDYLIKNNLIFKQLSGESRTKFDDL